MLPHHEVLREIKALRSHCSTGPENIPTNLVSNHLASPLTHIINTYISKLAFPTLWKTARISPIPKVGEPQANDNFLPVSNLPVLSKVYERPSLGQMMDFFRGNYCASAKCKCNPQRPLNYNYFACNKRSYPQGNEQRCGHHCDINSRLF